MAVSGIDLEKVFGGLTYGYGGVSIPVFIANYLMDVMKELALVGVVILLLVFLWDILVEGGRFVDSLRRHGTRLLLVGALTFLMFTLKGPHQYNGVKTYTVIDLYASIFRMGEKLADALAYQILYGGKYGTGTEKPTDASKITNFFEKYGVKNVLESLEAQKKLAMIEDVKATLAQADLLKKAATLPSRNPWKALGTRMAKMPNNLGFSLKASYGKPPKIDYGYFGMKNYDRKYEFPYSPTVPFREALMLQAGGSYVGGGAPSSLKPVPGLSADALYAASAVLKDISGSIGAIDLSKFSQKAAVSLKAEKEIFEKLGDALDKLAQADYTLKAPPREYYGAMESVRKKYGNSPYYAAIAPHMEALASKLAEKASEIADRSKPVSSPDGTTAVYPWNASVLSSAANDYKRMTRSFFYGFIRGLVNVPRSSGSIVDAFLFRKPVVFASLIANAPNAGMIPEKYAEKISAALSGAEQYSDGEIDEIVSEMRKKYDELEKKTKQEANVATDAPFDKSLAELYGREPKNMTVTWQNLGYFYSALKSYYTKSIVFNTYALALDAIGAAEKKKSDALSKALADAESRAEGAAEFTDAEKTNDFANTIGVVVGVTGVIKGLGDALIDTTDDEKGGGGKKGLLNKFFGKTLVGWKAVINSLGGVLKGVGYMLVAKIFLTVIYVYVPALLWMMAVVAWYMRTSVMVATFPVVTFMAFFKRKSDVLIGSIFQAFGQALVPFVMVAIFFIVITFSIVIENVLDYFMPVYDFSFLSGNSSVTTVVDSIDSVTGNHLFGWFMDAVRSLVMIFINTQLMLQFFRADDYVSDFIGARISYGTMMSPESVMSKMRVNV